MKSVTFLKQGMENFCNHIEPIEIEFGKNQLLLVTGPNGSGKTSLIQALPFTLYGQCEKGRGDDVLNTKTGKNCHTWTEFMIDQTHYRVDRYVKYTKVGNNVFIFKDGSDKPYLTGHKEVVPEVKKLLLPRKSFINTLLFSQKVKTFFTDLTDSEQKEIFRKIMGLIEFLAYQKESGVYTKEIEAIISKLNSDMLVAEKLISELETEIITLKEQKVKFELDKEKSLASRNESRIGLESQKTAVQVELDKHKSLDYEKELGEVNNEIGQVQGGLRTIGDKLDGAIREIDAAKKLKESELNQSMSDGKQKETELNNKRKSKIMDEANRDIEVIEAKIKKIDRDLNETETQKSVLLNSISIKNDEISKTSENIGDVGGKCPTCLQDINEECIQNQHLEIEKMDGEVQNLLAQVEVVNEGDQTQRVERNKLVEKKKEIEKFRDESVSKLDSQLQELITSMYGKLKDLLNRLAIAEKEKKEKAEADNAAENSMLKSKLQTLFENKSSIENLIKGRNELETQIETFDKELRIIENETKNIQDMQFEDERITSKEQRQIVLNNEVKDLIAEIENNVIQSKMSDFWQKGFSASGIQSMLIDEAIPFMNRRVGYYLDLLSGGRYTVSFDTLDPLKDGKTYRDKISINVFDNQTHANSRIKLSGGQERIVDVATILTLCDLQSNIQDVEFNILLFDEIFDSLDDANVAYVSNLLRMASSNRWIGVISHRHIDQIEADEILEFH